MRGSTLTGMTRVTVTLPDELAERVRADADNLSAWVADAIRVKLQHIDAASVAAYEAHRREIDADGEDAWEAERFGQAAA